MNFMKSKAGFTLVELIVVIAILGILAGIAVPAYSGYIKKAESAADLQVLSSVNTAAQGLAAAEGATVEKITVTVVPATDDDPATVSYDVDTDPADVVDIDEVEDLIGDVTYGKNFKGATWEDGEWTLTK